MLYFQQNGIENFSMSKMAADLKMSKTTIYNHFETKEEVIEAAVDYKLSVIKEYETVLHNLTLPFTERYRKSMLFFCVQTF
ncbi:MAG: AcrR family transcriptional regulator, partial [Flavobacteriales bacterium]